MTRWTLPLKWIKSSLIPISNVLPDKAMTWNWKEYFIQIRRQSARARRWGRDRPESKCGIGMFALVQISISNSPYRVDASEP